MPSPADTNCGVRSDSEYGNRTRNHPITLTDQQALNQDNEPSVKEAPNTSMTAGPSVSVYQQTGDLNTKMYKLVNNKIIAESAHTLKLSNGRLLRKPGVAIKKSPASSKQVKKSLPKPPTPQDPRKKLAVKGTRQQSPQGRRFESENETESDEDDYQPLISRRTAGKPPTGVLPPVQHEYFDIGIRAMGLAVIVSEDAPKNERMASEKQDMEDAAKQMRGESSERLKERQKNQRRDRRTNQWKRRSKERWLLRCKRRVRLRENPAERRSERKRSVWCRIGAKNRMAVWTIRPHAGDEENVLQLLRWGSND